ncbi:MAG: chloramphenicol acetyltransferase [Saprospiraceae bacterium]|nr:chloramphenicol acetyltransferase [Bacteroidia bacterium]NNE15728.1 chloramphenicol acetyltransferase [Saprospiraceae bacterium]
MDYKDFDVDSWGRKNAFHFYKKFDDPYFNVTANVSINNLLAHSKKNKQSFFLTSLYVALKAANTIDNFKMRYHGEKIKIYDKIHGGSTLFYDDESFGFAYYDFIENEQKFHIDSQALIHKANETKSFDPSGNREDLIYFSSLPWISFTSLKHAQDKLINPSIPRISFGKYFKDGSEYKMPVSVEVNHALMDGYHLGLFFERYETLCR